METDKKQKCNGCEKKRRRLLEETKMFEIEQKMLLEKYNKKMEEKEKKIERKKGLAK
tara:strand:+ start:112 stop:282 length:171 start_codon:yes stop_codon:yes gene_type:complete